MIRADATERGAREDRHAGLVEQPVGQLGARQAGAGDVREDVERALRAQTTETRERVEPVDDEVAACPELLDHRVDRILRAGERLDGAHLGERRGAGHGVDDQPTEPRASGSGTIA